MPAAIFNNQSDHLSDRVSDSATRALMSGGRDSSRASRDFIYSFQGALRKEIISVYSDSLKLVWQVAIVFSALTFLLVFVEKEIKLRTELDTEYGLKKVKAPKSVAEVEPVKP